ncbi:capsule biosynthesis protein [Sedimentitalea nanhaiensis]|uniref:Capsular polysaccharide transport system permease protein n=1 Tax=Sedimentitalea nanhaiensis TaxID=999627 RepID=A0A1I7E9Z0_9RHOB|nr:capsule biosynthesis protein [Sedimentitalea nanhaiensis]SFU20760.1 capsular polysaccharide transport system permease protein [Sedimentitalea nanhaiensis]
MTMKPKARKFRIRRNPDTATDLPDIGSEAPGASASAQTPKPADTAAVAPKVSVRSKSAAAPPAAATPPDSDPPLTRAASEIDAIQNEGLTGRQLRMARRVAQKHDLPATSDYDAVRLLRQHGIDPFKRAQMLELVVPQGGAEPHEGGAPGAFASLPDPEREDSEKAAQPRQVQLPQTVPRGAQSLPSTELSPAEMRNRQISEIQRDIARRRRRKLAMLLARLTAFVLLPTALVGFYFYKIATPMYSAKSEFLILQADNVGGGGLGGLLTGTQFATSQDSIAVQSYLQSKDAMLRLDRDLGFQAEFSQDWIDPIQRLPADASNETAYKTYRKNVKIGYDPTEGVIRMEVIAPDPQISAAFSTNLISYAEDRVNNLSHQKRGDQMQDAMQGFENAQKERRKAQESLVQLQQKGAILDPEGVIAGLRSQINNIEIQLQEKQLQLAALLDNTRPNQAKVDGARGDIGRLQDLLDRLNARMIDASNGENSLAQLSVRIQMAQADLATRDMMLQSALQQVEQTRMEANRQVRYLTVSVNPVPSQDPSYPRKFEDTILAFLIFSGIYLMISLTASILREQVTS